MSITNKGAGAKAAERAIESYARQKSALNVEREETAAALGRLRQELEATRAELALLLLPNAQVSHLQNLDACTPGLGLASLRSQKESERSQMVRRLADVEADSDYGHREALLSDYNGELGHGLTCLRAECAELSARKDALEACPTYTFALHRHRERVLGLSSFQTFWRAVTFSGTREASARKKSCEKFGYPDWDSMLIDSNQLYDTLSDRIPQLLAAEERRRRIDTLIAEQQDLDGWVHRFEEKLAEHLQAAFSERVTTLRLDALCGKLRGKASFLTAKLDALRAKVRYLESLDCYLEGQASDRQARISKLTMVKNRWAAKSWDRLRSDKTKWLVTVPAIKSESCDKCCRWSRRVRQNIEAYQDYESYGSYLAGIPGMLPYDAFAYGSVESMPYEGFTRQAISALDRHRVTNHQTKADYAPFKKLDKELGRKARDPMDEGGSYDTSADPPHARLDDNDDDSFDYWDHDDVAVAAVGGAVFYASTTSHEYGDLS
jgi:hypothetical protein